MLTDIALKKLKPKEKSYKVVDRHGIVRARCHAGAPNTS